MSSRSTAVVTAVTRASRRHEGDEDAKVIKLPSISRRGKPPSIEKRIDYAMRLLTLAMAELRAVDDAVKAQKAATFARRAKRRKTKAKAAKRRAS